jgi:hypothetical protein
MPASSALPIDQTDVDQQLRALLTGQAGLTLIGVVEKVTHVVLPGTFSASKMKLFEPSMNPSVTGLPNEELLVAGQPKFYFFCFGGTGIVGTVGFGITLAV